MSDNRLSVWITISDSRGVSGLKQAFDLLKHVAETKPANDGPEAFGQDLFVLCAELSFQVCFYCIALNRLS